MDHDESEPLLERIEVAVVMEERVAAAQAERGDQTIGPPIVTIPPSTLTGEHVAGLVAG
jgi:hypothetical protein